MNGKQSIEFTRKSPSWRWTFSRQRVEKSFFALLCGFIKRRRGLFAPRTQKVNCPKGKRGWPGLPPCYSVSEGFFHSFLTVSFSPYNHIKICLVFREWGECGMKLWKRLLNLTAMLACVVILTEAE